MLVLLPFTIYFFCIGIIVDKEALLFAFSLLIILICLAFICFVSYKAIKKITIKSFDKFAKNDVIEYKLLKNKDIFELICLNNDEKFTFNITEVKKIKKYKNVIILKINSKYTLALPNIKDIENLMLTE